MELAARIRNSYKLRELAELVGRFKRLAIGAQSTKITHGVDEVYDIELGAEIVRTIPSEFMYLSSPETEMLFWLNVDPWRNFAGRVRGYFCPWGRSDCV